MVVVVLALLAATVIALGTPAVDRLSGGGLSAPGSEAARAEQRLKTEFGIDLPAPTNLAAPEVEKAAASQPVDDAQSGREVASAAAVLVPTTALALLLVLGGLGAALIPLLTAAGVGCTTLTLFALLAGDRPGAWLAATLGAGLGYSLTLGLGASQVIGFRADVTAGHPATEAARETAARAGRTAMLAAAAVAGPMACLALVGVDLLSAIAAAGVLAATLAGLTVAFVLPPLLGLLGHRVNALSWRPRSGRRAMQERSGWLRWTGGIVRRPARTLALFALATCALVWPLAGADFGTAGPRPDPRTLAVAEAGNAGTESGLYAISAQPLDAPAVESYARRLSEVDGVARVEASTGRYQDGDKVAAPTPASIRYHSRAAMWVSIALSVPAASPAARQLVTEVRGVPVPTPTLVGGAAATLADAQSQLRDRLPVALIASGLALGGLVVLFGGSPALAAALLLMVGGRIVAGSGIVVLSAGALALSGTGDSTRLDLPTAAVAVALLVGALLGLDLLQLSAARRHGRSARADTRGLGGALAAALPGALSALLLIGAGMALTALIAIGAIGTGSSSAAGGTGLRFDGAKLAVAALIATLLVDVAIRLLALPALVRLGGSRLWRRAAGQPVRLLTETDAAAESAGIVIEFPAARARRLAS